MYKNQCLIKRRKKANSRKNGSLYIPDNRMTLNDDYSVIYGIDRKQVKFWVIFGIV